jgi:hypothetical protein
MKNVKLITSNIIEDTSDKLKNLTTIIPYNVICIETDTGKKKKGNGIDIYDNLSYYKELNIKKIHKIYEDYSNDINNLICSLDSIFTDENIEINNDNMIIINNLVYIKNTSNTNQLFIKFKFSDNNEIIEDLLNPSTYISIPIQNKNWKLYINGYYKVMIDFDFINNF